MPCILPAAFYALSIQRWRNGSTAQRAQAAMSPEDLTALFAGREAIQDVLMDMVVSPLSVGGSNPPNTSTVYPPSPAPSPAPKSPIVPSSTDAPSHPVPPATIAPETVTPSTPSSSKTKKELPAPPHLTFCSPDRPCRAALCALWRRTLSPDSGRPWGTWIVRELHKLAALPRDTLGATSLMNELKTLASNDGECVDSWPDAGGDCLMEEVVGGSVSVSGSANASPNLAPTVPLAGGDPPALLDTKNLKGKGKMADVNVAKKLVSFTNSNSILKSQSLSLGKGKVVLKASASSSSTSTSLTATTTMMTTTTGTTTATEAGAAGTEPVAMIPMMSETERGRRAEARAPVCARCWEENRKLARWRLRWMCDAIPGMFGLDIDAHAGGAVMGLGVGEGEGMEGGFGSSSGNASNANANGKGNANVSGKVKGGIEDELKSVNSVVRGMNSKAKEMVKAK